MDHSKAHYVSLVGRVTPCAPVVGCLLANGAHGVTRPTLRPMAINKHCRLDHLLPKEWTPPEPEK